MGSFKLDLLEPAGVQVRELLYQYVGRRDRFRGAARGRVYFKVQVRDSDERRRLLIASDEIRDLGYEVTVDPQANSYDGTEYVKVSVRW
jgi:hypothetical protein